MRTLYYPALIEAAEPGGFGVSFPDFPGCVSAGATLDEAAQGAREALALHVEGMVEDGVPLPDASAPGPDLAPEGVLRPAWLFVEVLDPEGEPARVNISLPATLLRRIDYAAQTLGMTRSGYIAAASRRMLEQVAAKR